MAIRVTFWVTIGVLLVLTGTDPLAYLLYVREGGFNTSSAWWLLLRVSASGGIVATLVALLLLGSVWYRCFVQGTVPMPAMNRIGWILVLGGGLIGIVLHLVHLAFPISPFSSDLPFTLVIYAAYRFGVPLILIGLGVWTFGRPTALPSWPPPSTDAAEWRNP